MKKALIIIVQLFCLVVFLGFTADAQSNCTYTVNPNSLVVPISGGNYSLDITTQADCPWTVIPFQSTRPPSISFTSPTSGTGSGKVDFTIEPNTSPSIREGGIAVKSPDFSTRASVEIVQDVQCSDPMFGPSVVNVPGEGSTQLSFGWSPSSVNCSYITVRSNDSWITLTGTSPEQRYTFSVAPNTGPARTGTISIIINTRVNTYQKIGTLTVNQAAGQSNCTYSISAVPYVFYLEGGARTIDVTTQPGCAWQAIPSNDWITITSGQSGSGNGTVNYSVSINNGDARMGTINISGRIIEINQRANCFANFNSGPFNFPASGGTFQYPGPFYQGCSFSSISTQPAPWVSQTGGGNFFIAPNTGPARSTIIELVGPSGSINGGSGRSFVTINQASGQTNCTYTLNPTGIGIGHSGGSRSFNVITQEGCAWTAFTNQPWITITGGASGTGNGTVTFTAASNFSDQQRTGIITVNDQVFTVSQNRHCLVPSGFTISVPSSGATGSHTLTTSCFYSYQSNDSWIISGGSQGGTSPITYTVQPNPGAARTGTITVRFSAEDSFLITINQAAGQSNCTYTLTRNYTTPLPKSGGNYSITVNTQEGCSWTVENNTSWIVITSGSSGTGNGTISFTLQPNTTETRGATMSVAGQSVSVLQSGGCNYTPTPASINVPSNGGQGSFTINLSEGCGNHLTVDYIHNPWIKIVNITGEGALKTYFYSVDKNLGEARTGTITFSDTFSPPGGIFTVNQAGQQNCTYSINPTSIQAGVAGGDTGFNITTETGCNWTAQSNASWITVSNTTGSGAGRINYSIQSNTGAARQGTITAGGQTFTINQDAVAAPVELIRASGRVIDASFKSIRGAIVSFTNLATGETRTTMTNHFGYFHFANIERGQPYSIAISHKRYKFTTRTVIYNTGALIPIYNPDPEP